MINSITEESEVTLCANCGVRLYQVADPNNLHWHHAGTGDVRCPTRFAEPSRASVVAPNFDQLVSNVVFHAERNEWDKAAEILREGFAAATVSVSTPVSTGERVIEECERRAEAVVEAAIAWHESGQEGQADGWFEASERLTVALEELRYDDCPVGKAAAAAFLQETSVEGESE